MRAVVYFTYSKRRTSEKIAKEIEGEHFEIRSKKVLKRIPIISMISLGFKTAFDKRVDIEFDEIKVDLYDEFVFVFPIWASRPAIYMAEFFKQVPIKYKKISLIGTSDSGNKTYAISFSSHLDETNDIIENTTYKRDKLVI